MVVVGAPLLITGEMGPVSSQPNPSPNPDPNPNRNPNPNPKILTPLS